MLAKRQGEEKQEEFWIERAHVEATEPGFFQQSVRRFGSDRFCMPGLAVVRACVSGRDSGGGLGFDPVVYFKMLMVGFVENLRSERAIAARCEDSLSVSAFLGYGLEESTPDHSSLSVIRHRLGSEIYQGGFEGGALGA